MKPRDLHDILRALPLLELQIVAAVAHIVLKGGTTTLIRISDLRQHFYRLTNTLVDDDRFLRLIVSLQRNRLLVVHTNAASAKDVTDSDRVSLLHPPRLLQNVFREESSEKKVVIAARIREAILNPQAPLLTMKLTA